MKKTKSKSHVRGKLLGKFEDLVKLFPPHAIEDEIDYNNNIEMLDWLTSTPQRTEDQNRYLETLSILVEAYEEEHHAIDTSGLSPLELLNHLMEQHGMNASQLGELLGNRALGSKILRGSRQLSKRHIKILAEHFNVSAALFI
ncbi:MAG: transcriptional regulator [Planctomycetes bacterium]|nr:transcriptional regulator [Planctomycetota bacterium]